jgi:hypothetical protein
MPFVEPSESLFAHAVLDVFDDVTRLGFDVVEPLVYGCSFFNGSRTVSVQYDRRRRSVRTVLQQRLVVGQQPAAPHVNLITVLTAAEQPIERHLATVLAEHLAAVREAL